MGAGRTLLISSILLVLLGYWLYVPVPAGYSTASSIKLHLQLAFMKIANLATFAGEVVGYGPQLDNYRSMFIKLASGADIDPTIVVEDAVFNGIKVRIYRPPGTSNGLPGLVYYHGGGWVIGSIETCQSITTKICKDTNTVVVSVEYRLAPEHPFPAAIDDCAAATKYFLTNAEKFNVDPNRIAVGGDSAGGNLAAAVSLKLRDEDFTPKIKLQILIYPVTQGVNFQFPSYQENSEGPILSAVAMAVFVNRYLDGTTSLIGAFLNNTHIPASEKKKLSQTYFNVDKLPKKYLEEYSVPNLDKGDEAIWKKIRDVLMNPYFSPLVAGSLSDLPMAYVFSAEHDPLRDDALLYADRLREAKVKVTHGHSDIGIHGMMSFTFLPECLVEFDRMTKFILENI